MDLLELVKKAQAGDNRAFSELCLRFKGLVRKYAKQAHVRAISEEAEAEAWLAAAEAVRVYDEKSGVPVAGFIESRVKYAVWNLFKREKRRWQHEVFLQGGDDEETNLLEVISDDADIAQEAETRIIGREIQSALLDLPARQRLAILRTVLEGRSLTETAKEMGITVQAIYNLRKRALGRLRLLCSRMYRSEGGETYGNRKNAASVQTYH